MGPLVFRSCLFGEAVFLGICNGNEAGHKGAADALLSKAVFQRFRVNDLAQSVFAVDSRCRTVAVNDFVVGERLVPASLSLSYSRVAGQVELVQAVVSCKVGAGR